MHDHPINYRRTSHFTLVELLVVITIIVILISLLLPSLISVRAKSKSIACANNLRQLTLAATQYAQEHRMTLPGPFVYKNVPVGRDPLPWSALLLGGETGWGYDRRVPGVSYLSRQIVLCPGQPPDPANWNCWNSFGITPGWHSPINAMSHSVWMDTAYTSGWAVTGTWFHPDRLPAPEAMTLFADTVNVADNRQYYSMRMNAPSSGLPVGIHLRHLRKTSMAYVDGHVESNSAQDLQRAGFHYAILSPNAPISF